MAWDTRDMKVFRRQTEKICDMVHKGVKQKCFWLQKSPSLRVLAASATGERSPQWDEVWACGSSTGPLLPPCPNKGRSRAK